MKRRSFLEGASLSAIAAALLVEVACSGSSVVAALETALEAIQIGLPTLAALTGIPQSIVTATDNYVAAVNTALQQSTAILAAPGTDAEKAAAILALFASIAVPVVPAQYQALAQLLSTVASDVAAFLSSVPRGQMLTAKAGHTTSFSAADRARLAHAKEIAADNVIKLAKLRDR